jgi:hypothetical protein
MTQLQTLLQWYTYNPLGAVTVVYGAAVFILLLYGFVEAQFENDLDS